MDTDTSENFSTIRRTKLKLLAPIWLWCLIVLLLIFICLYIDEIRPWLLILASQAERVTAPSISPADTGTYFIHAFSTPLSALPYNLFGPVFAIKLSNGNFDLIVLFYVALFSLVLRELYCYAGVRSLRFAVLFLINPLVMFQFFAPNKEIMTMIALLFAVVYIHSGRLWHLILLIAIAALSKIEIMVLIVFFLGARKLPLIWRPFILVAILALISIFYLDIPGMADRTYVLMRGQTEASYGFTVLLQELAAQYYFYVGIIIPRLLLAVLEGGVGLFRAGEFVQSGQIFVLMSGFLFMFFFTVALFRSELRLKNDIAFLLGLFFILVTVVPFPHHRYILPAYPLLLLLAFRARKICVC